MDIYEREESTKRKKRHDGAKHRKDTETEVCDIPVRVLSIEHVDGCACVIVAHELWDVLNI